VAWLFLIAYWVAAFAVASFVYARWNRGVHAELNVSDARAAPGSPVEELPDLILRTGPVPAPVFEGDSLTLDLRLVSPRGTRGPARMHGRVGDTELSAATGLIPAAGASHLETVGPLRRGVVGAVGWELETSDLIGLFRHRTRAGDSEVALVLPRFGALSERVQARELEASVTAPRAGSGNELFGVREYRPGDPLRRIHWRSSARHGELIVREYEPPGVQTVGILCDPDPPSREAADQVARLAASEAWDCLRAGGRVVLWAPGCEPTRPEESRSIWPLLEWLARYPAPSTEETEVPLQLSDAIAVTASPSAGLADALDTVRRRGGSVRAWVVGDVELDTDAPVQRTGLKWPF
jgi:uncharacterized protein (DUF58 family)